jgi:hypothetical protein
MCYAVNERGSDKRQVVIHVVHSKPKIPSKVSLSYVTFVPTVPILLFAGTVSNASNLFFLLVGWD